MSLSVTIKSSGATLALPSEGDNGNQEIDTLKEAEAALSLLKDDSDGVSVGGKDYTRADLVKIRDANQAPPQGASSFGTGLSHGISLEGFYQGGVTHPAHSGAGARLQYELGASVATGNWNVTVNPSVGVRFGTGSMDFLSPNAQPGVSIFTAIGGSLGVGFHVSPPVANHRLFGSAGVKIDVSGFGTPASTTVELPPTCTPDMFGRGECEINAGPKTGNAGSTGLYNEHQQNARGTSGLAFGLEAALGIGGDIARGAWGSLSLYAEFAPRFNYLSPKDGHAFSYASLGGNVGIAGRFGGNAAERTEKAPTEPKVEHASLAEQPAANEIWNLDPVLQAQLPAGAQIRSVSFDGNNLSGPPYSVPAGSMTAGSHTLRVAYRMPGDTEDRIRELTITVALPTTPPAGGGGYVGIEHNAVIER